MRRKIGAARSLTFAGAEELYDLLGVVPGCVTPFAVDCASARERGLRVVIDTGFINPEAEAAAVPDALLGFHPFDGTLY